VLPSDPRSIQVTVSSKYFVWRILLFSMEFTLKVKSLEFKKKKKEGKKERRKRVERRVFGRVWSKVVNQCPEENKYFESWETAKVAWEGRIPSSKGRGSFLLRETSWVPKPDIEPKDAKDKKRPKNGQTNYRVNFESKGQSRGGFHGSSFLIFLWKDLMDAISSITADANNPTSRKDCAEEGNGRA